MRREDVEPQQGLWWPEDNFCRIDSLLTTSGQPSEEQLARLAGLGIGCIVNLGLTDDPRYALSDEQGLVRELGMAYIHIPVQFTAPTDADLQRFFQVMATRSPSTPLHLHCAANKRVTAFLGLYRLIHQQMEIGEAFAPLFSIWHPDAVWAAFLDRHGAPYGTRFGSPARG